MEEENSTDPIYDLIQDYYDKNHSTINISELFESDSKRFEKFSLKIPTLVDGTILIDYSKNRITSELWKLLLNLAESRQINEAINQLFSTNLFNFTENRAILHVALRNRSDIPFIVKTTFNENQENLDLMPMIIKNLEQMKTFVNAVILGTWKGSTGKRITDVVNISNAILGLGPDMITKALSSYRNKIGVHYVTNIDGTDLVEILRNLNYETTLFIIVSRDFNERHVLANAIVAKDWLLRNLNNNYPNASSDNHFVTVSNNEKLVMELGIRNGNRFKIWDWVDDRFSLWSSAGLSIPLAIGFDNYLRLLDGAEFMDNHFRTAELEENAPIILALLSVWYSNFYNSETQAILPYNENMSQFPKYIQQLEMQCNGKMVTKYNENMLNNTATVIWGDCGTNYQFSCSQILNQGTRLVPCDLIGFSYTHEPISNGLHNKMLLSNFIGQSEALMIGKSYIPVVIELAKEMGIKELTDGKLPEALKNELTRIVEHLNQSEESNGSVIDNYEIKSQIETIEKIAKLASHKVLAGNRPTTSIILRKLTPCTLGTLIALYEHKIFVEGIIWNINSFDSYGTRFQDDLSQQIELELQSSEYINSHDSSTNGLINFIKSNW